MARFRYKALDEASQLVEGDLSALDAADVVQILQKQGLKVQSLEEILPSQELNRREALELGAQLAEVLATKLPVAPGLRAVAEELALDGRNEKLISAFRQIADRVESGESLDVVLASTSRIPESLSGIIAAGAHCRRLDETLSIFVELRQRKRRHYRLLWSAFGYSLVSFVILCFILGFLAFSLVPSLTKIFFDFEAELPQMTKMLIWFSEDGIWYFISLIILPIVALLAVRLVAGRKGLSRTIHALPFVGELVFCNAMAESSKLLGVLLRQKVALPDALQLTSRASLDGAMANSWQRLSDRISDGIPIAEGLEGLSERLENIRPVIAWSEANGTLDATFDYMASVNEGRAEFLVQNLRSILPAMVFFFILVTALYVPIALFLPLVELIKSLT